ncbi:hypothetical protein ACHAW6_010167 [Cyclotella cf. meneghiniana]
MYGLPQSGLLANKLLKQQLNQHGYCQSKLVPGLWTHKLQPIAFTLIVDGFGGKYVGKEHALHLKSILKEHYTVSMDWTGTKYIGLSLDWDYTHQRVHLSKSGYVSRALKQFQHHQPSSPQHQPFRCVPIHYGAKRQFAMQLLLPHH